MTYVNAKLPNHTIVVTKDCDRTLTVRRRHPTTGDAVNWGAAVYILVDVDRNNPTRVEGTVDNSLATIRMESSLLNLVRNGTTWRVVMSQTGAPSLETAVMVGAFERNDGK